MEIITTQAFTLPCSDSIKTSIAVYIKSITIFTSITIAVLQLHFNFFSGHPNDPKVEKGVKQDEEVEDDDDGGGGEEAEEGPEGEDEDNQVK